MYFSEILCTYPEHVYVFILVNWKPVHLIVLHSKHSPRFTGPPFVFDVLIKSIYFILYSETQCISKLDKIGIFIDMKFH